MDVRDKVVIVTGASSGIGLAVAELLSRQGAKVALAARSKDKLEAIAAGIPGSLPVVADMSRERDVARMVSDVLGRYGRVDILINNAGRGYDAPVEKIRPDAFRALFELNVVGPLVAMQHVIPVMRRQGGGLIVNISSGLALMTLPGMSPYAALKSALGKISLTARAELHGDRIRVSVVYPYITLTEFEANTIRHEDETRGGAGDAAPDEAEGHGPLRPPDTPEYLAEVILKGIGSEDAEIFAHDWMRNMARA